MLIHKRAHNVNREKGITCKTCGKAFYTKSILARHELIHSGERPHICKTCETISFKTAGDLKSHMRAHIGDERWNHPCDLCDKKFTKKS